MSELIDVLDENGIKTGEVLSRNEIHQKGLWHRAIVVAIVNKNNQVLLQQRSFKKDKNAGKWDISVAGHISTGHAMHRLCPKILFCSRVHNPRKLFARTLSAFVCSVSCENTVSTLRRKRKISCLTSLGQFSL